MTEEYSEKVYRKKMLKLISSAVLSLSELSFLLYKILCATTTTSGWVWMRTILKLKSICLYLILYER